MQKGTVISSCWLTIFVACLLLSALLNFGHCANSQASPLILLLDTHESAQRTQVREAFKERMQHFLPQAEFIYYLAESAAKVNTSQLVSQKTKSPPDIIITLGSSANEIAQTVFPDIPVLSTLIMSRNTLLHKEKNAAILLQFPPEVQLQWLQNILPRTKRVGILYDPVRSSILIREVKEAARKKNIETVLFEVNSPKQLQAGLKYISRNADVLLAIPDPTVYSGKTAKEVLLFSYRNRIPFVGLSSTWVKAGALYAIEVDYRDLGRQAAELANKILKGGSPGKTRVFNPEKVAYSLNLRTKDHLRLDIAKDIIKGSSIVFD